LTYRSPDLRSTRRRSLSERLKPCARYGRCAAPVSFTGRRFGRRLTTAVRLGCRVRHRGASLDPGQSTDAMSALPIGIDHVTVASKSNHALRPRSRGTCKPRGSPAVRIAASIGIRRTTATWCRRAYPNRGMLVGERTLPARRRTSPSGPVLLLVLSVVLANGLPLTGETHLRPARWVDRSAHLVGEPLRDGIAVRMNPSPRTLRIMETSFDPSTLRRSRPI
jgi:hypothetical protein